MLVFGDKLEELDVRLEILSDRAVTFAKASATLISASEIHS